MKLPKFIILRTGLIRPLIVDLNHEGDLEDIISWGIEKLKFTQRSLWDLYEECDHDILISKGKRAS